MPFVPPVFSEGSLAASEAMPTALATSAASASPAPVPAVGATLPPAPVAPAVASASAPNLEPAIGLADDEIGLFPQELMDTPLPLVPVAKAHSVLKLSQNTLTAAPLPASAVSPAVGKKGLGTWFRRGGAQQVLEAGMDTAPALAAPKSLELTEGFYRGALPDVLFVWGSQPQLWHPLIDEWASHLQKLQAMGFLLPNPKHRYLGAAAEPIQRLLPAMVLVGPGVFHLQFIKEFQKALAPLGFDEDGKRQLQKAVLGKCCRGQTMGWPLAAYWQQAAGKEALPAADTLDAVASLGLSAPAEWLVGEAGTSAALRLRIAGGSGSTQRQIAHALGRNGVVTSVENEGLNAPERLELDQLHAWLQSLVLPVWYAQTKLKPKQSQLSRLAPLNNYRLALSQTLFALGHHRKAFEAYERHLVLPITGFSAEAPAALLNANSAVGGAWQHTVRPYLAQELLPHLQALLVYQQATGLADEYGLLAACAQVLG